MRFFSVSHNSFYKIGFPWPYDIVSGLTSSEPCDVCGGELWETSGDIEVTLEPRKGTHWSDVLGCGAHRLLIVSGRVLEAWRTERIGNFPNNEVRIVGKLPKKLADSEPPPYYWIDGAKIRGAKLDFEASGFVDATFCSGCGRFMYDVSATHHLQRSKVCPFVFVRDSWNGAKLFTTDRSSSAFFCTEEILNCARKYKLTNFEFIPIEDGSSSASKGVDYLRK